MKNSVSNLIQSLAVLRAFYNADYTVKFGDVMAAENDVLRYTSQARQRILYYAFATYDDTYAISTPKLIPQVRNAR